MTLSPGQFSDSDCGRASVPGLYVKVENNSPGGSPRQRSLQQSPSTPFGYIGGRRYLYYCADPVEKTEKGLSNHALSRQMMAHLQQLSMIPHLDHTLQCVFAVALGPDITT
jgi:hypothetical protein